MIALAMLVGGALFSALIVAGMADIAVGLGAVLFAWHVIGQVAEWLDSVEDRRVALRRWRAWRRG